MCNLAVEQPQVNTKILIMFELKDPIITTSINDYFSLTFYNQGLVELLSVRCRGHLLSIHEICASVHICFVYNHSHGTGFCIAQRLGHVVRDVAHGSSLQCQYNLSQ